jgi:hypothetical protein
MPRKNIEGLKLPDNWREEVEKEFQSRLEDPVCRRLKGNPRYMGEFRRILNHHETEWAVRYLLNIKPDGFTDLTPCTLIGICADGATKKPKSRKEREAVIDALRVLRRNPGFIASLALPEEEDIKFSVEVGRWFELRVDHGIRILEFCEKGPYRPGPKSSPSFMILFLFPEMFRKFFGRPCHEATAAFIRATFPDRKCSAEDVKTIISRRSRRGKQLTTSKKGRLIP